MTLDCKIDPRKLSESQLQCGSCNKCRGKSILDYPFPKNLKNSDDLVREIIKLVTTGTNCHCEYTTIDKNPDINVFDKDNKLICRIEAKYLEGQAFMKSKEYVGLWPKEALVVDEPKLDSYVECANKDWNGGTTVPIYIVWKFDRPCEDVGGITVFQELSVLCTIRQTVGRVRAFERRSASNDYVSGSKMGITKKYHYSIRECLPIEELIPKINSLI